MAKPQDKNGAAGGTDRSTSAAALNKTELFERRPIPGAVMTLAIPTVLSSLVMILYNLADTYFVGLLNDPIQTSAVTLAAPVLLAFNAVNNLFGVGSSSVMSRALGLKDYETVRRSSAVGFYCALVAGLGISLIYLLFQEPLLRVLGAHTLTEEATAAYLFWTTGLGAAPSILNVVLAYLVRAEGSALYASLGTMSGCLLNIVLDPFFILPWGLGMGAAGAGLATFLANLFACGFFFVFLRVKKEQTWVSIAPSLFRPDRRLLRGIFTVGIPASIQNLLNVTGMTVLNNFTAAYGADAVAAMGIATKVDKVPFFIALGSSQGVMPLIGYNYAARNEKRMKEAIRFTGVLAIGFLLLTTVVYWFSAEELVRLFMKKPEVVAHGLRYLRGMCLAQPFLALDFLAVGVFQACGMGKTALFFAILRKIILEIPALFILNRLFPPYGIAYAQLVAEVILAVAAVLVLIRLFRRLERQKESCRYL